MFNNANNNFNTPRNNGGYQNNVTTRIRTFFGDNACLQLSYWNENISIKLNPLKSVSPEGIREYDYDAKIITAIASDKATALADAANKYIVPVMNDVRSGKISSIESPVKIGFPVGNKGNHVYFIYQNDDKGVPSAYLAVYTITTENGEPDTNSGLAYKFEKTPIIIETAEGKVTEYRESEFLFVVEKLEGLVSMNGDGAHTARFANSSYYKTNNAGQSAGTQSTGWNTGSSAPANTGNYSAPVSNFDPSTFPFA